MKLSMRLAVAWAVLTCRVRAVRYDSFGPSYVIEFDHPPKGGVR